MPSYLTFASTEQFRNRLLTRNLQPYHVQGVYGGEPITNIIQDVNIRDYAVVDSPDDLIANDPFADILYPLNAYGPLGGYDKNINVGGLANTRSNLGPYDYTDAMLLENSESYQLNVPRSNKYGSVEPLRSITLGNIQSVPTFQGYTDPLNFTPSSYTPYQILLNDNPSGSDGTLSQDSYIAQLGAKQLKQNFQWRIAREIERNTIGRLNLLNAVGNPEQAILIAAGKEPLIEKSWTITRPSNYIFRAADFIAKLEGYQIPVSVIPGDYFNPVQNNLSLFGQVARAFNGGKDPRTSYDNNGNPVGDSGLSKIIGRYLSKPDGSQVFLNNTGSGQKSQLFYNLSFNRYGPNYDKSFPNEIIDSANRLVSNILDNPPQGQYYVGSKQLDASFINSPSGELPIDPWGREMQSSVYGPNKLSVNYEGDTLDTKFKMGPKGLSLQDGGDIAGGIIWTSRKYNTLGFSQVQGGGVASSDFVGPKADVPLDGIKTFGFNFKQSSILDNTQRIVESTPEGKNRLQHAGNAINQLSKVFNDGYKEITKGSAVLSYTRNQNGTYSANTYCRVFTKDVPYYSYGNLQKTDGNIRKFTYSVLDNTYNLNITPGETSVVDGKVKKYMFSIENLAWRTSNRPGLTVDDLPACEKGPNGGRVMWFPPYDIKFNETSTPTFRGQDFLGRPEPVYTYTNTKRSGTLSWKIIVDHPSILNVIAQKELKNNSVETNKIIDSFIAGCLKYDIYELAKRWGNISKKDIYILQEIINKKPPTEETITQVIADIPEYVTIETTTSTEINVPDLKKYENVSYFFENDTPDPNSKGTTTTSDWETLYQQYIGNQSTYVGGSPPDKQDGVNSFFDDAIKYNYGLTNEMYSDILKYFEAFNNSEGQTKPRVTITLVGTASAVASETYNVNLSLRRVDSIRNYIKSISILTPYVDQIDIVGEGKGEAADVETKTKDGNTQPRISCGDKDTNVGKTPYEKVYSPTAMACRKVVISAIDYQKPEPKITKNSEKKQTNLGATHIDSKVKITTYEPTKTITESQREGISKYVLRRLLNECDYFEAIKESNPMFTGLMKERLKFFNPTFHSITPEGLNSRLTFLQQCMRPGDTIPTIVNNERVYNDARNTAFGAPPVLVLRIGDFFNTKIIPQSLNITYEPLLFDLNPEGIGVQPMLANVSLNFEIIGGEGLKGPIDKLQNALSFNFYANTEMYDERADPTDDSYKKIDADFINYVKDKEPPVSPTDAPTQLENEAGDTIGTIQTTNNATSGVTGTITYQKIMDDLYDAGQSYIDTLYGKTMEVMNVYNVNLWIYFAGKRLYNKGKIREFTTPQDLEIFGKNNVVRDELDILYGRIMVDIDKVNDKNDPGNYFINYLYSNNVKKKIINVVKENLKKEVSLEKETVVNFLGTINQTLVQNEQNLVKIMAKLDFVDTNSDGFQKKDNSYEIYNITATTEVAQGSTAADTYQELTDDYKSAGTKLNTFFGRYLYYGWIIDISDFNIFLNNLDAYEDNLMIPEDCPDCFESEKRFFMGMSHVLLDSVLFENFREKVLDKGRLSGRARLKDDWEKVDALFDEVFYKNRLGVYDKEKNKQLKTVNGGLSDDYEKTYKKWNAFVKGKTRKFEYSNLTPKTSTQEERFGNIYKEGNSNEDNKTFNGKNKFN